MRLGPGQGVLDDQGRPVAFRQWSVPDDRTVTETAATQRFRLLDGLDLQVERRAGDRLRETYRWANTGDTPLEVTSPAVSTPWRDVDAADRVAHETAVHAHLSATGAQAWALAKPLHGQGPFLGLTVREGAVRAYSVGARNQFTGSNVRGHLLLHVTDRARHPQAFGGQPALTLAPGASYRLVWELAWFEDEAAFLAVASPPSPSRSWTRWSGPRCGSSTRRPCGCASAPAAATPAASACCSTAPWPSWCAGASPSCSTATAPASGPGPGVRGLRPPDRPDRDRPGVAGLVGRRRADGHAGLAGGRSTGAG